jgi:hypothetical protein
VFSMLSIMVIVSLFGATNFHSSIIHYLCQPGALATPTTQVTTLETHRKSDHPRDLAASRLGKLQAKPGETTHKVGSFCLGKAQRSSAASAKSMIYGREGQGDGPSALCLLSHPRAGVCRDGAEGCKRHLTDRLNNQSVGALASPNG